MPPRSSVERTPGAEALVRARMRDGATIDEITDTLAATLPDADISRSAVGRYTKAQRELLSALERTDILCDVIGRMLTQRPAGAAGPSAAARAEALRTVIFDRQIEGGSEMGPGDILQLERARHLVEQTFALERRNAGLADGPGEAAAPARQPLSRDAEAAIRAQMERAAEPPAP